jgi:hypothetical protein
MPGCVPVDLVVIIAVIDGAVFDRGPLQIFTSGSLFGFVSLGRDGPGSAIKLAPTAETVVGGPVYVNGGVGGDREGNEWGGICASCNSVLFAASSSSVVESMARVWPRIELGRAAGV